MKNERYTDGQKNFLKLRQEDLSEQEREMVRYLLLPRKRYLPQTEEEALCLVRDIVGEQRAETFCEVRRDLAERFGVAGRWSAGDSRWRLYCRFSVKGRSLCSIGMDYNVLHMIILFGAREREKFETERDRFSRLGICWTYDLIGINSRGLKELKYDITDATLYPELLRLLEIKLGIER